MAILTLLSAACSATSSLLRQSSTLLHAKSLRPAPLLPELQKLCKPQGHPADHSPHNFHEVLTLSTMRTFAKAFEKAGEECPQDEGLEVTRDLDPDVDSEVEVVEVNGEVKPAPEEVVTSALTEMKPAIPTPSLTFELKPARNDFKFEVRNTTPSTSAVQEPFSFSFLSPPPPPPSQPTTFTFGTTPAVNAFNFDAPTMPSIPSSHDIELNKSNEIVIPKLTVFEGASNWGKYDVSGPEGTCRCAGSVLKEDIFAPAAPVEPVTPVRARNVSAGQDSGYDSGKSEKDVTPPPVEGVDGLGLDAVNVSGTSHKGPFVEEVKEEEVDSCTLHEDSDVESVTMESPAMRLAREEFEAEQRHKELKARLEVAKEKVGRRKKGGKKGKKEKAGASQEVETNSEEEVAELLAATTDDAKKVNPKRKNKGRARYQNAKRGTGLVEPGK